MSNSVPEGWVESSLGNIADIRFSNVDKKSDFENEEPVKLCNYMDVYSNSKITNSLPFMQATAKDREIKKFSLLKNDVIITKDSETPDDIAVSAYVSEDLKSVVCGYHLAMLRPEQSLISGEYLNHLFGLDDVQHYFYLLANGITRFGLTTDAINNAYIIYPPLPEQKKIAAILTSVDTVIEKTQAQIDKLKDLKTGMMQELLTKGIGHTEFKDSPVGRIPVGWEVVTLADLISSMDGGVSVNSENKQKASGEMGILKTSCVSKGNFYPNENKVVLHNEMDRLKTPVKDDHIIFSRMNTPALVGESGYVNKSYDDLFLPDRLWLIDVYRDKVYVLWLSYILAFNSTRKKITDAATGTSGSMKNISKPSLLSIKIAYPQINEQEKIASILKSVDKKLNKTLHKLSSYQNIKKALMQDLLTGKVQVKL